MEWLPEGNEIDLMGAWPCDEGEGTTVLDWTGNGQRGFLYGPSWAGKTAYTVYHTNATPTNTGLEAYTVTAPGVQTVTVSADHPLILFNLDVSLEWDARQDAVFLEQLRYDLQRTSELLYDWTNGQAALGEVTIYQDRGRWNEAHLRIYATNTMRPSAVQGGVVSQVITDSVVANIVYEPGQVRMGAMWNRYGDPGGSLGEDWPRTLAHELGHYIFFLDDNYLGLDPYGLLVPIDGCTGAMSDPYRQDYPYDEFHADDLAWQEDCMQTLSQQSTGRADWETIPTFYPWVSGATVNTGPSNLPLVVTDISFSATLTAPLPLDVPIFSLEQDGSRVLPGPDARAFLFQGDRLIDLGQPTLDQVLARGARLGDRLCVYELSDQRLGCEVIESGDSQLNLVSQPDWQPEIVISPVTSRTLTVSVRNVAPGLSLYARIFPADDPAQTAISLIPTVDGYTGTLTLEEPSADGHVQVWLDEADPRQESIVSYSLGGNPGYRRSRIGYRRSRIGYRRSRIAPVISTDGQVILFGDGLEFEEGEFYTFQQATLLPSAPPWTTAVGQGYWLSASPNAPDLDATSISFGYLGSNVPPGEESWLRIYFWDGESWHLLPTYLDTYHNMATASTQGPGLYALMSSIEISLDDVGWNLFPYPVQGTRPVTEALRSLDGFYTTVYGWDSADPDLYNRWRVFDVTAPPWVNTLHKLEFGRCYWITVTEAITLYLKGAESPDREVKTTMQLPPATYYGEVRAGSGFTPYAGMTISALIDGHLCGQAQMIEIDGQVVYAMQVWADDGGSWAGCGAPRRTVTFYAGSQPMRPTAVWNNSQSRELPITVRDSDFVYLPLVMHNQP